tara:strand:+ start:349 stop:558 length:210 start_codon:yes stop_codon:yes gene_type:complete
MKILFIIFESISEKKSLNVLNALKKTSLYKLYSYGKGQKMINLNSLKSAITGKICTNSSENNNNLNNNI